MRNQSSPVANFDSNKLRYDAMKKKRGGDHKSENQKSPVGIFDSRQTTDILREMKNQVCQWHSCPMEITIVVANNPENKNSRGYCLILEGVMNRVYNDEKERRCLDGR